MFIQWLERESLEPGLVSNLGTLNSRRFFFFGLFLLEFFVDLSPARSDTTDRSLPLPHFSNQSLIDFITWPGAGVGQHISISRCCSLYLHLCGCGSRKWCSRQKPIGTLTIETMFLGTAEILLAEDHHNTELIKISASAMRTDVAGAVYLGLVIRLPVVAGTEKDLRLAFTAVRAQAIVVGDEVNAGSGRGFRGVPVVVDNIIDDVETIGSPFFEIVETGPCTERIAIQAAR